MSKTENLPVRTKRISADEAHNLRKDHLRPSSDGKEQMIKVASSPSTWDAARRSARFVMTSQAVDRYGDVVVTEGVNTLEFEKNPVAFLNHNSGAWPIGNWENVIKQQRGRPPRMEGDLVLHKAGGPVPEIDQAAWMIENGYMRGASIGFIPDWENVEMILDANGSWTGGLQFNGSELLECSLCGIPANQQALVRAVDGDIKLAQETLEYVLDNWARSPEGLITPRAEFEAAYRVFASKDCALKFETELANTDAKILLDFAARELAKEGKIIADQSRVAKEGEIIVDQSRVDAIERAAKQKRLEDRRQRDRALREERIAQLRG